MTRRLKIILKYLTYMYIYVCIIFLFCIYNACNYILISFRKIKLSLQDETSLQLLQSSSQDIVSIQKERWQNKYDDQNDDKNDLKNRG